MTQRTLYFSLVLGLATAAHSQLDPTLAAILSEAVDQTPSVAAHRLDVQQAEAAARAFGSPMNPELEIAPGIGFTNSNFVLGQSFDPFGVRTARARRARAEVQIARANLAQARLEAGGEVLTAFAEHRSALAAESLARAAVETATNLVEAIGKRIEVGEAPAIQLTRAEVELARARQALVRASSFVVTSRVNLNSRLGKPFEAMIPRTSWGSVSASDAQASGALARRPEAQAAAAYIEVARAAVIEAKRQGAPSVFAGFATDTWSLDRRPFHRDNVGLQIRLSMPPVDRGENLFAVRSAELASKARAEEAKETSRRIGREVEAARISLTAAQEVAKAYESDMLPKAEQMVQTMRTSLEAGLSSFLDVLEAQKTLVLLRTEAAEALRELYLAEVRYLTVTAQLPMSEKTQS